MPSPIVNEIPEYQKVPRDTTGAAYCAGLEKVYIDNAGVHAAIRGELESVLRQWKEVEVINEQ